MLKEMTNQFSWRKVGWAYKFLHMTDFLHLSHVEKFLHVTDFLHIYHVEKFSTWQHVMGRISPHDQFSPQTPSVVSQFFAQERWSYNIQNMSVLPRMKSIEIFILLDESFVSQSLSMWVKLKKMFVPPLKKKPI